MSEDDASRGGEVLVELPPSPEFVATARMVAASFARHFGFGDEQVEDLKIAVSEAITNSIRAHEESNSAEPVRLTLAMNGEALTVSVADSGPGFEHDGLLPGEIGETPPAGQMEGGLGLTLIRTLISDTMVSRPEAGGTVVTMVVKREAAPA